MLGINLETLIIGHKFILYNNKYTKLYCIAKGIAQFNYL